jgi:ubiquitin thioesterase protein OTUB1
MFILTCSVPRWIGFPVKKSSKQVTSVGGYEEMAIEIFHDTIVEFLESLSGGLTKEGLHQELTQDNATSDYCTWYLRVLTATYLKSDPMRFIPYLEDGYTDIATFCQTQIEPMGKECSMVQVLALAEAFQVLVKIEYLDGHEFTDQLTKHVFGPESSATQLALLYRPGHYDILYPK